MIVPPFAKRRNDNFIVKEPLTVFDQQKTPFCGSCAATSIGEDYFGVEFEPSYTHAKVCQLQGQVMLHGITMDMVCEAVRVFGLLPRSCSPYSIESKPPSFLADWKNWDSSLDKIASQYKAKSYKPVIGFESGFELVRYALSKGHSVLCGVYWQQQWDSETYIDSEYQKLKFMPHAVKAYGQKIVDGKPYIKLLNSRGTSRGENGSVYVSKKIKLLKPYILKF